MALTKYREGYLTDIGICGSKVVPGLGGLGVVGLVGKWRLGIGALRRLRRKWELGCASSAHLGIWHELVPLVTFWTAAVPVSSNAIVHMTIEHGQSCWEIFQGRLESTIKSLGLVLGRSSEVLFWTE